MPLEQDAEAFQQQLLYSLGDEPWQPPQALELVRRVIAEVHADTSALPGIPGLALQSVYEAFGPLASSALARLTGLREPIPPLPSSHPHVQRLALHLGHICQELGGSVEELRLSMEFVFRDLWEAAQGHAQPQQHLERLLHLALGIEAAFQWHDVCRVARTAPA
jgi:hypothetical protein